MPTLSRGSDDDYRQTWKGSKPHMKTASIIPYRLCLHLSRFAGSHRLNPWTMLAYRITFFEFLETLFPDHLTDRLVKSSAHCSIYHNYIVVGINEINPQINVI